MYHFEGVIQTHAKIDHMILHGVIFVLGLSQFGKRVVLDAWMMTLVVGPSEARSRFFAWV